LELTPPGQDATGWVFFFWRGEPNPEVSQYLQSTDEQKKICTANHAGISVTVTDLKLKNVELFSFWMDCTSFLSHEQVTQNSQVPSLVTYTLGQLRSVPN
jgi:hypothetical protein